MFSTNSYAQQTNTGKTILDTLVTIPAVSCSLKECLSDLTAKYHINFSYINDEIPLQKQMHCKITNAPLRVILDTISNQADIRYFLIGTQIVLKKSERTVIPKTDTSTAIPANPAQTGVAADTVYVFEGREKDIRLTNKKYKKYFSGVFGKRRVKDSMIVVSADGTKDTIGINEKTKKHHYVNRVYVLTRFSAGAYAGIGSAYRKLSGDDWFVTERNSEEHSLMNYVLGIQVTHYRKSKVSFRSGLQYITFGEKGTYKERIFIQSQPGPPTEKIIVHEYRNRYNYLMLPVMAGYSFQIRRRTDITFYSGVALAFFMSNASTFEQSTNNGTLLNPAMYNNRNPFLYTYNNVSLVFPVQAQIAYRISMRTQVFATPMFNYFLTSIYSKNDVSSLRPYAFNLSIGVNYFFKIRE